MLLEVDVLVELVEVVGDLVVVHQVGEEDESISFLPSQSMHLN